MRVHPYRTYEKVCPYDDTYCILIFILISQQETCRLINKGRFSNRPYYFCLYDPIYQIEGLGIVSPPGPAVGFDTQIGNFRVPGKSFPIGRAYSAGG